MTKLPHLLHSVVMHKTDPGKTIILQLEYIMSWPRCPAVSSHNSELSFAIDLVHNISGRLADDLERDDCHSLPRIRRLLAKNPEYSGVPVEI